VVANEVIDDVKRKKEMYHSKGRFWEGIWLDWSGFFNVYDGNARLLFKMDQMDNGMPRVFISICFS